MPKTVSIVILTTLSLIMLMFIIPFSGPDLAKAQNIVEQNNGTSYNASGGFVLTQLFSKVQNSVVQVTTSNKDSLNAFKSGLGSGFVYDKDGHIITNYHVISLPGSSVPSANDENITVTFSDGVSYDARLVGSDPFSDIAVLQVQNMSSPTNLKPLPLANSLDLKIGQPVAAIGNPFGLSGSMTEGIVSGLGRLIPSSENVPSMPNEEPSPLIPPSPDQDQDLIPPSIEQTGSFSIPDIIQTDAPINPGNSGGPLLNLKGEVVGMSTAIFSSTGEFAGIGFAIPSNTIIKVVPSLISSGSYVHPWIGIAGTDVTPDIAHALGLKEARGFLVTDVTANSPADKSGIKGGYKISSINGRQIPLGGDVVLAIDNKTIRKVDDILTYLEREKKVGDAINLSIFRDGKQQEINLTLAARPSSDQQALQQEGQEQRPSLGISGINITPEIARAMNLTQVRQGLLVVDIIAKGPADKAGLRGGDKVANINGTEIRLGGDIIIKIDNQTVSNMNELISYLKTKDVGDVVHLQVLRDGKVKNIALTLGPNQKSPNPSSQLLPPEFNIQPFPSPNLPFDGFYDKCTELIDKETCNYMFGR